MNITRHPTTPPHTRCHDPYGVKMVSRTQKRPRLAAEAFERSCVYGPLDRPTTWWAEGDLNPHVHKDTRT